MVRLRELLTTPSTQLDRASRFVVFQIKLWSHCARLLKKNRSGQQAAALSYHTVFGIVPLAIVTLLIFQSFPAYSEIGEKMKDSAYRWANLTAFKTPVLNGDDPEQTKALTEHIDELVVRFFDETNKGQIGLFSVLIVIWAALALLTTIEKSFNNIWHVATGRNLLHRIISYWALLTLGPLLVGVGIYLVTKRETVLPDLTSSVLSYGVAVIAFFLLYYVLPNTKVNAKPAIWGAVIAALVWVLAKSVFRFCITELELYQTVYGAMALIPMTVLWIYITWLIVLFGLQLTFTTQHLKTLDAADIAAAKETEEHFIANDLTLINIIREIASAFENSQAPIPPEEICSRLDLPGEFGEKILDHLVNCGLVVRTSDPTIGYFPAKDPANMRLSEVAEATAMAGFAQSTAEWSPSLKKITQSQRRVLARHNLKETLNLGVEAIESECDAEEPAPSEVVGQAH